MTFEEWFENLYGGYSEVNQNMLRGVAISAWNAALEKAAEIANPQDKAYEYANKVVRKRVADAIRKEIKQ